MVRATEKVRTVVPTEIILANEGQVEQHYGQLIRAAKTELTGKVKSLVSTKSQKSASSGTLLAFGIGAIGIGIAGLALWQIITGILALGLLAGTAATGIFLKLRYPVWMAKLRANQVIDLARAGYQKELDLIGAKNAYLDELRQQAANDPIATRHRIATETANEIDQQLNDLSEFEGLFATQGKNIKEAKKKFPDKDFSEHERMQAEADEGIRVAKKSIEIATWKLKLYISDTEYLETNLKLAAGARSLAEFLRDDTEKDRIREMISKVATEASETEFNSAMAALRTSVAAVRRTIPQS